MFANLLLTFIRQLFRMFKEIKLLNSQIIQKTIFTYFY